MPNVRLAGAYLRKGPNLLSTLQSLTRTPFDQSRLAGAVNAVASSCSLARSRGTLSYLVANDRQIDRLVTRTISDLGKECLLR